MTAFTPHMWDFVTTISMHSGIVSAIDKEHRVVTIRRINGDPYECSWGGIIMVKRGDTEYVVYGRRSRNPTLVPRGTKWAEDYLSKYLDNKRRTK